MARRQLGVTSPATASPSHNAVAWNLHNQYILRFAQGPQGPPFLFSLSPSRSSHHRADSPYTNTFSLLIKRHKTTQVLSRLMSCHVSSLSPSRRLHVTRLRLAACLPPACSALRRLCLRDVRVVRVWRGVCAWLSLQGIRNVPNGNAQNAFPERSERSGQEGHTSSTPHMSCRHRLQTERR